MNKTEILSDLISSVWAVEPGAANKALLLILSSFKTGSFSAISPDEVDANKVKHAPFAVSADVTGDLVFTSYDDAPENSIAVIPVQGGLTPHGYYGIPGTEEIGARVKEANNHKNIAAIVFTGNSPGGSVHGTERLCSTIASVEKPTVTHVKGGIYSAALWSLCPTDHIMLDGETVGIGSIGTMYSAMDFVGIFEKLGAKELLAVAEDSPDKNKAFYDLAKKGSDKAMQDEVLKPLNAQFKAGVITHRGEKLNMQENDEPMTGKIYFGSKAIKLGLADSMGSFDDAITLAFKLAGAGESSKPSKSQTNNMLLSNKFKALTALAAKQKKGEAVTAEELQAVNDELQEAGITGFIVQQTEEHKKVISAFSASVRVLEPEATDEEVASYNLPEAIKTVAGDLSQATDQLKTATAEIQELTAKVEKLESTSEKPEKPVTTGKEKLETATEPEEESYSVKQANKDLGDID